MLRGKKSSETTDLSSLFYVPCFLGTTVSLSQPVSMYMYSRRKRQTHPEVNVFFFLFFVLCLSSSPFCCFLNCDDCPEIFFAGQLGGGMLLSEIRSEWRDQLTGCRVNLLSRSQKKYKMSLFLFHVFPAL